MTQAMIERKIHKTTGEMQELIRRSKRKLLELEVMLSLSEIRRGKFEKFKSAKTLFRRFR